MTTDRAINDWLRRSHGMACGLADMLPQLVRHLDPSGSGVDGSGVRTQMIDAPAPIRLEVIDLQADIAATARRYADLVRGTLRTGPEVSSVTADRLRFIGGNLYRLYDADPDLTDEIVSHIGRQHRTVLWIVGPEKKLKPFRLVDACPDCGLPSLWADPKSWRIACGMPSCGGVWDVDAPLAKSGI